MAVPTESDSSRNNGAAGFRDLRPGYHYVMNFSVAVEEFSFYVTCRVCNKIVLLVSHDSEVRLGSEGVLRDLLRHVHPEG
jgi:hypothetical protein